MFLGLNVHLCPLVESTCLPRVMKQQVVHFPAWLSYVAKLKSEMMESCMNTWRQLGMRPSQQNFEESEPPVVS